ncbi:MAG: hypothetical protein FWC57_01500 [Endomicrobia bacterium]|nr:hypothetical protein [Endomicrobiia bacterium]
MKRTFVLLLAFLFMFSVCAKDLAFAQDDGNAQSAEVLETDGGAAGGSSSSDLSDNSGQAAGSALQTGVNKIEDAVKTVQKTSAKVEKSGFIEKILDFLSMVWQKIKKIFSNLPGIKQYNESSYSSENYKKEMDAMGAEYASDKAVRKKSESMLKEGSKKFFKGGS